LANISSVLGDIFRFLYKGLLHCFCCACRAYSRNRRRRNRRVLAGKMKNSHEINYTGTTSIDPSWPEGNINDEEYDDDDEEDQDDIWYRMESRVPFGAVMLIIIGYVGMGGFMFSKSEGWTMIQSVYFCYITLSTIGFGDYVCTFFF